MKESLTLGFVSMVILPVDRDENCIDYENYECYGCQCQSD
jgi:hypothetical protein